MEYVFRIFLIEFAIQHFIRKTLNKSKKYEKKQKNQ